MSVQITDCTIRDGGYLLNKNSKPDYIRGLMRGLVEAGIDYVETGFLQTNVTNETLVYANSVDARKYLPVKRGNTSFLGFCDNSRYSINKLDDYDGKSFEWLRISFAKHEIDTSIAFCKGAMDKGYKVQFNPMDILSYTQKDIKMLIEKVNTVKPGSLSIVDTFGSMHLEDLERVFSQFDSLLVKDIKIGLHSHDNLGLSNALAEILIRLAEKSGRDVIIDGSLLGMGRGAGNAATELLANYLNRYHGAQYNISALIETISEYIEPIMKITHWGYGIPMFICGSLHAHVDNIYWLMENKDCSAKEMYNILLNMSVSQRTRYGKSYSKTDFSDLNKAYDDYIRLVGEH